MAVAGFGGGAGGAGGGAGGGGGGSGGFGASAQAFAAGNNKAASGKRDGGASNAPEAAVSAAANRKAGNAVLANMMSDAFATAGGNPLLKIAAD